MLKKPLGPHPNPPPPFVQEGLTTRKLMIGMSLRDAVGLKEFPLVENYPSEDTLPEDGLYHYLVQSEEEHNDQYKRAVDRIWSKKSYRLRGCGRLWQSGDVLPLRWT